MTKNKLSKLIIFVLSVVLVLCTSVVPCFAASVPNVSYWYSNSDGGFGVSSFDFPYVTLTKFLDSSGQRGYIYLTLDSESSINIPDFFWKNLSGF